VVDRFLPVFAVAARLHLPRSFRPENGTCTRKQSPMLVVLVERVMSNPLSRRRVVQLGSTGTALALTGRLAADDDTESEDESDTNGEYTVAIVAAIDEDEVAALEEEFMEQIEEGEIDQSEAQTDFEEDQRELIAEAIEALEARVEEADDVTVTETAPDFGLALVDGESAALIETLEFDEVAALLPEAAFEEAQEES
jgi:hypothetical protein